MGAGNIIGDGERHWGSIGDGDLWKLVIVYIFWVIFLKFQRVFSKKKPFLTLLSPHNLVVDLLGHFYHKFGVLFRQTLCQRSFWFSYIQAATTVNCLSSAPLFYIQFVLRNKT